MKLVELLPRGVRKVIGQILLFVLVITFLSERSLAFPDYNVRSLARFGMQYEVGTTLLHYIDTSRLETFTQDPGDVRELFAQAWYPTDVNDGYRMKYIKDPGRTLKMVTDLFGLPSDFFQDLGLLETKSIADVPISEREEKYPVLIFQHGYSFWVGQNTRLMEYLASHGYIILSIAHAFESCYSISNNGEVLAYDFYNPELTGRWQETLSDEVNNLITKIIATEDVEKARALESDLVKLSPLMTQSAALWSADASFLLDQLEILNMGSKGVLAGKMNLSKIGAIGMSFGGAATAQFVVRDRRVRAGINLDGGFTGYLLQHPLTKPFMFMLSENHEYLNNVYFNESRSDCYTALIDGARHLDFCDLNQIAPEIFQEFGLVGSIDKHHMNTILENYCKSFFDRYLLDSGEFPPKFESVKMRSRNI